MSSFDGLLVNIAKTSDVLWFATAIYMKMVECGAHTHWFLYAVEEMNAQSNFTI